MEEGNFYWKCSICKKPIMTDLVERFSNGKSKKYHKYCIENSDFLIREANQMLGLDKNKR